MGTYLVRIYVSGFTYLGTELHARAAKTYVGAVGGILPSVGSSRNSIKPLGREPFSSKKLLTTAVTRKIGDPLSEREIGDKKNGDCSSNDHTA